MNQTSKRYATALFKSAPNNKEVEQLRQQLHIFKNLYEHHAVLSKVLHTPLLNKKEVAAALFDLTKKYKFSPILINFFQLLSSQKRLPLLDDIILQFDKIVDHAQGVLNACITSAHTISAQQKKSLTDLLEQKLSSPVKLREVVNTDLLGGYIIQIGPYLFDNTLSYKLNKLNQSIKKVI
jgi:F-type H+-transporting ATPase subunit delta